MSTQQSRRTSSPRAVLRAVTGACAMVVMALGCMGPIFRPQSPDAALSESSDESSSSGSQTQLISAVAHPYGMNYVKIENVAPVTGLAGTGEDPAPSPQRAALLAELNRREIEHPNEVLSSTNNALVLVRGFLRPGIQAGDTFDVEVRVPSKSDTTSLRGGWMMETRLSETAVLGGQILKGHESALAKGPILVDPSADAEKNPALATQGRVLNGGLVTKSRTIGLILDNQHKSIRMSQLAAKAINGRFHTYIDGRRMGVATPKTDEYIELAMHPRYKNNVGRYMRVMRSIAVQEKPAQQLERLKLLHDQLFDVVTAETAALRLEGIGSDEAIAILEEGAAASDHEVRFYAAEALAYLDVPEAVAPLAKSAVDEPAFRIAALAALGAMEDVAAAESLAEMLSGKNARNPVRRLPSAHHDVLADPRVKGENMNAKFTYHVLDVTGDPMVHVTSSHRREVVLFGKEHDLHLPCVLDAGPRILVNGLTGSQITVSRFNPGEPTQQRVVSTKLDEVIRAVVDLGGDYPDVVQMLQQAKNSGALASRFRVNALPEPGREVERKSAPETKPEDDAKLVAAAK